MKAAVCIHAPLPYIVKQYIITLAFSGHICSHMIKSSINILPMNVSFYSLRFHSPCCDAHLLCPGKWDLEDNLSNAWLDIQTQALVCQLIQQKCRIGASNIMQSVYQTRVSCTPCSIAPDFSHLTTSVALLWC